MGPLPPQAALDLRTPGWRFASSQCGWGFHIVGAVSTRPIDDFVPGLLELLMYGRIHDAGMAPYPLRAALDLRTPGWGLARSQCGWDFNTVGSASTRGTTVFVPGLLEL